MKHTIGIVGVAGDLGGQLAVQAVATGHATVGFARHSRKIRTIAGADLVTRVRSVNERIQWADSVDEVLASSDIVHWCAPLNALSQIKTVPDGCTIVLHDSVMSRSAASKDLLLAHFPGARVAIVHCLMNTDMTVVVADGHDVAVSEHFLALGLRPKRLDISEHDLLMAHSQAPLAVLCKLLLDDLEKHHADGLLTNSGQALRAALIDRSAQWTEATYDAILSNPELPKLIVAMQQLVDTYTKQSKS